MSQKRRTHRHASFLPLALAWLLVTVGAFVTLVDFGFRPGSAAAATKRWPERAPVPRDLSRPTLVVFLHPACTHSQATLDQLVDLLRVTRGEVAVHLLFRLDPIHEPDPELTPLRQRALGLTGTAVGDDTAGQAARLFGATHSGQVLLYGVGGELLFSGGISAVADGNTPHPGRAALQALLTGNPTSENSALVHGCPLEGPLHHDLE